MTENNRNHKQKNKRFSHMNDPSAAPSNVPEFTVSDLAMSLKRTLEETYGHVRVRGELSRVSIAASGHMYSSLKDDNAVIDAVCWKGVMSRLSVRPEEGLEVICTGRLSTFPKRSNYQLVIESMELAGEGALLKMLEERKKKLAAEGLFDPARKRPVPKLPAVIGVVTSPTGAVIRDILHRLADRFPSHVILWPALVQGQGAAEQIAAGISGLQTLAEHGLPTPDVIIVARGGGSLEDLMAFNEEIVVRAAADCVIPLISAVGHETDTTLIDYAADLRAPTPTGAAEMAVPVRAELLAVMQDYRGRLLSALNRRMEEKAAALSLQSKGLGDPTKVLEIKTQNLDRVGENLGYKIGQIMAAKESQALKAGAGLKHPQDLITFKASMLERWSDQLSTQQARLFETPQTRLAHAGKMLEAYSFQNVLQRGYTVIRDDTGKLITSAQALKAGESVDIEFYGGDKRAATIEGAPAKTAPVKKAKTSGKKPATDKRQESLF